MDRFSKNSITEITHQSFIGCSFEYNLWRTGWPWWSWGTVFQFPISNRVAYHTVLFVPSLSLYLQIQFPLLQLFPSCVPDLSSDGPISISGRCRGSFPDSFKAKGILATSSDFVVELKVHNAKDIPLDKVRATKGWAFRTSFGRCARRVSSSFSFSFRSQVVSKDQIDQLTAQAWFSENKQLEDKVFKALILL